MLVSLFKRAWPFLAVIQAALLVLYFGAFFGFDSVSVWQILSPAYVIAGLGLLAGMAHIAGKRIEQPAPPANRAERRRREREDKRRK